MQIEHELHESPVKPRQVSCHHHEPCSGDAPRSLEIHPNPLAQRDVVLRRERKLPRGAPAPHFDVRRLVPSVGNARVRNIGQAQLQIQHLRLYCLELLVDSLQFLAQGLAQGQKGTRILPLGLGLPHRFCIGIALGAQPIGFYLHGLALLFEGSKGRNVEHEPAPRQSGGNSGQIATQQLRIEQDEILDLVWGGFQRFRGNVVAMRGAGNDVSAETPPL